MEGGFGFPFGGDPDDLMRGLREFRRVCFFGLFKPEK